MDRKTNEKTKKYELKDGQNRTYLYNGDIVNKNQGTRMVVKGQLVEPAICFSDL